MVRGFLLQGRSCWLSEDVELADPAQAEPLRGRATVTNALAGLVRIRGPYRMVAGPRLVEVSWPSGPHCVAFEVLAGEITRVRLGVTPHDASGGEGPRRVLHGERTT